MKARILFYLVCVFFRLGCCGVVPSNFKSSHDEHTHAEDIFASNGTKASIPTLENSEFRNTSSSTSVDHHQLNTSEVVVSDFHDVSDLNHVQHAVAENDLAVNKSPKESGRTKKKSPKVSTRFKKTSQAKIDHAGMNDRHEHHGSVDDHASEPHPLQITDHKAEDFKINSSVDGNSSEQHHLQTVDHKAEDLKIHGSIDDHSLVPHHLQTDHKSEDIKINSSVDGNSSEQHHLQTDHKAEDLKIHASVDDHSLEPHHLQTDHNAEDVKIHGLVGEHLPEPHHLELDPKSDNFGFHGTAEDHFSELEHASENFSRIDINVSKSVHVENITANFDGEPKHSKDFATIFDDIMLNHDLNNKERDFINQAIDNENHTEHTKHDANNLNEEFSKISDSDDLINSVKDLTHDWNNTSQETKNGSINNNLSEFSNAVEDVRHYSNNLSQDSFNDPVASHSSDFVNSVLGFTNDSDHANKDHANDSVVVQSNYLAKSENGIHTSVSEDLKSVPSNTLEFKNDSHDPPKTTESEQEHFNQADNNNSLFKSTVASITNSKLFLNIHNSFMRLNPTDQSNSTKLKHEDETSENVISVSDDLTASKINGENSNKPSSTDAIFQEVNPLDIKEGIPSPSSAVSDISDTETENEVKFPSEHTEKVLIEPKLGNKSESINIETNFFNAVENSTSQGLFSSLGLDFLMNSELAKNAASAMEVFNFTDSALTDHIIDDQNDMHDLLDIRSSVVDDHNLSNSESSEQINNIVDSSKFNTDSSTFVTGSSKLDTESSTLVKENSSVVHISDEISEVNKNLNETFAKKIDSSSELSSGNGSIEALTATTHNTTEELVNVTMVPAIFQNSTVEFEATTNTAQPDDRNASHVVGEVRCPPPGICIFWFFAQDTCTINSHCLGSTICCRIGCSKTCVEV